MDAPLALAMIALLFAGVAYVADRPTIPVTTTVTNSDGTLTISPTVGAVVASLNLAHANTWTATQTFQNIAFSADNTYSIGTATNRGANFISNLFSVYHASGDANPTVQLGNDGINFGQGGSAATNARVWSYGALNGGIALQSQSSSYATGFSIYPPSGIAGGFGTIVQLELFAKGDGSTQYFQFQYQNIANAFEFTEGTATTYIPIIFANAGNRIFELTTTPSFQIDNSYNIVPSADSQSDVGTNALRFSLVRAVTITSGDFNFWPNPCGTVNAKGMVVNPPGCNPSPLFTLTESPSGLVFVNHVTAQNQTFAMLNNDGSPSPALKAAIQQTVATVTVTTTTTTTVKIP